MTTQTKGTRPEPGPYSIPLPRPLWFHLSMLLVGALLALFGQPVVSPLHAGDEVKKPPEGAAKDQATNDGLAPAALADKIEREMQLFDSVEYTIEYTESRNVAPWNKAEMPDWVDGEGRYLYRGDGSRWFLDEHANTFNSGEHYLTPEHRISGFDGRRHFHFNSGRSVLVWGEDDQGRARAHLPNVLWRCGNSAENLLWVLRNPDAKIAGRPVVAGHPCIVVELNWGPDWDKSKSPQRLEVTISPEQSYLPLKAVWERNGKVTSESEMRGLNQTPDGLWYPLMIRINRNLAEPPSFPWPRTERIKSLVRRGTTASNRFDDDELQYVPPSGIDIVDRRLGVNWHNDPWWPELAPWIKETFDWPRSDTGELVYVASFCDQAMAGGMAPPIEAAQWLNAGNPGAWNRPDRFISVLYFFGGTAIDPHPKWAGALRTWQAKYRDDGVELIGVATSASPPAAIKQAAEELNLTFPIAIDQASECRGSYGKTFDAFKMQSYMGVVIVDPQGRVRLLDPQQGAANPKDPLDAVVLPLFEAAGRKPKFAGDKPLEPQPFSEMNARLPDAAQRAILIEWKRRAALQGGSGRIRGTVTFAAGEPPAAEAARVEAAPQLWLLISNVPGGRFVDTDRARAVAVECRQDGTYLVGNLRKGSYTLTYACPGFATAERKVVLPTDDSERTVDVVLTAGTISGQVVNAEGRSLSGAAVRAVNRHLAAPRRFPSTTSGLPRDPVTTGDDGRFRFESLPEGAYTFEISAQGYEKATAEIVILGTCDLKVVLKQATER
jgi:peroxiredoxin